ncbi:MAG TPA: ATP-binding cassette domain-containing protein [Sandaracinaceae bacterium LLY-WYZ-13_1]|nr:ATP-binding cassette domain-containing protein [Sandaracinaceae bacterium LLY-WYZ-13_1]
MTDATPLFTLRDVRLETEAGPLLRDLSWTVPERGVTVLLGPAGTGKSTLLRLLAGRLEREARGELHLRGASAELGAPRPDVIHVPQPKRGASPGASWREALDAEGAAVLLDEPDRAASDAGQRAALIEACRAAGRTRAVVVVTHDLSLARELADRVALLVAGAIVAEGDAAAFFREPPNELASRFLRQGNCWPAAPAPALPAHFFWVQEGRLAGMGKPGLLGPVEDDLAAIASAGVVHLVSLTTEAVSPRLLRSFGLRGRHFPVRDMGVPAIGAAQRVCAAVTRHVEAGHPVVYHCKAGLGRTGTLLAAQLVWEGASAEEAIARVRAINPRFIQVDAQLRFVRTFAASS